MTARFTSWFRGPTGRLLGTALSIACVAVALASLEAPALAIGVVVLVYVLGALVATWGRAFGLPKFRPDEAYTLTLDRWRKERRQHS
jgi:hypothetical protein